MVAFYNQRGTAELWIRESENAARLQLHTLAYDLANFMRTLALPGEVAGWSLTAIWEKLMTIGARIVSHTRYAGR